MKKIRLPLTLILCTVFCTALCVSGSAASSYTATGDFVSVYAYGRYDNWDGVTNVAQFRGPDGCLYYAIDADTDVVIHKTRNGKPVAGTVTLKKEHPLFGTAICDGSGYYYLVTGEANYTDDTDKETVFISKYDSKGKLIKTTGDNGRSSLARNYNSSFHTKIPFDSGDCDAAISDRILTVHYAREMYNGHQSDSVFTVDTKDMSKVNLGAFYTSHSFAQRVVPTKNGFIYVSEGDCFERAFSLYSVRLSDNKYTFGRTADLFDFWVEDGAYDTFDMKIVNNNFAHMGGIAALSDGKAAFAAQSVKSLSDAALTESEEIFIQIFDPNADLNTSSAYVTEGQRSGLAGANGRTEVTNYGVKWLTSYGNDCEISNVQIAAAGNKTVVLYELSRNNVYDGVWYILLDNNGNVTGSASLFSSDARLNPCEMPVYAEGRICWVGNKYDDPGSGLYLYQLDPDSKGSESADTKTGDVNGDGDILADDARLALRFSAKLEKLTDIQKKAADTDGNGQVLADDARHILRASAKLEDPSDWGRKQEDPSGPKEDDDPITAYEREVIRLINAERAKRNLSGLKESKTISALARQKALDKFNNTSVAGDTGDSLDKAGVNWNRLAESNVMGSKTPAETVDYWINSSGFSANILDPDCKMIGVGYCPQGGIWTQILVW
ncbi:MAG: hypothetical protein K6G90_02265 [Clostridia bacterium]|nr:hypothetical protein [Clostridia bacterium]